VSRTEQTFVLRAWHFADSAAGLFPQGMRKTVGVERGEGVFELREAQAG